MAKIAVAIHNADITGDDTFSVVDNNLDNGTEIGPITIPAGEDYDIELQKDKQDWGDCTITNIEPGSVPNSFHIVHDGDTLTV